MKTVIGGNGTDTTAQVVAWFAAQRAITLAQLYLIGEPDHPQSIWLTDWESPLAWPIVGTFQPAVIKRGRIASKLGLEVQSLDVTWGARNKSVGNTIRTANPYQLARMGFYDNWPVRIWTCYMPAPGDAVTFGCSEAFGGRIAKASIGQNGIVFQVKSFLDVLGQMVPTNVIEVQNTLASYQGAVPPAGYSQVPRFTVVDGSSPNVIVGYQVSPNPGGLLHTNSVRGGFLVFDTIAPNPDANPPVLGSTLDGRWSAISQNSSVNTGGSGGGGGQYNQFQLYSPMPWPPTSGRDSFFVSAASPINKADGSYYGFPYVPSAETAV